MSKSDLQLCLGWGVQVYEGGEVGWEETTAAGMQHLLYTCLAQNAKEAAMEQASSMALAKNADHVKILLATILERIAQGGRLVLPVES